MSSLEIFRQYISTYDQTGGKEITVSGVAVGYDVTRVNSDENIFTLVSGNVTINATGDFEFQADVGVDRSDSGVTRTVIGMYVECAPAITSGVFTEVPGTRAQWYSRYAASNMGDTNGSVSFILPVTAGDTFRVIAYDPNNTGNEINTRANASRLTIQRK